MLLEVGDSLIVDPLFVSTDSNTIDNPYDDQFTLSSLSHAFRITNKDLTNNDLTNNY
jgi:hypothetical protein